MDTGIKMDTWNKKLWPKTIEESGGWLPPIREASLIWVQFVGFSIWPKGYWVHHPATNFLDIERVEKGDMVVAQGEKKILIPEKTTIIIPPGGYTLTTGPSGYCEKRYLGLRGTILLDYLEKLGLDKITRFNEYDDAEFEKIFSLLSQMIYEKSPDSVRDYSSLSYKLLLFLANCVEQFPYPKILLKAKTFIDWNFAESLTLDDICRHVGCGKTTLQELFRNCLKTSPMQYLNVKRMKYAKHLLTNMTLPIKAVAARCGIKNQLYFSTAFKKYFNCSPSAYREKNCNI